MADPMQDMSQPPVPPAPPQKSLRGLRIALGISVALNLMVVGLVAGAILRDGGPRERMVRDLDLGPFTEALSPEDRDALRRDFVAQMPEMREMRRSMRAEFKTLLGLLRAEPFDPEAMRQALAGQRARMQERVDLGQELLLQRLAAMTPEARQAFADRLEERLRRGSRDGGRDKGRSDEGKQGG